jgi:hypothetical protein
MKRLLNMWRRPKILRGDSVDWAMQFRDLSCGCKALILGNRKKLWIVVLTETAHGSCYERSVN